jgi:uncharacterized membrane protein
MSNVIVVLTFDDKGAALSAVAALRQLDDQGAADFTLIAGVIVAKDAEGRASVLKEKSRPRVGVGTGALGALVGFIGMGGPVGAVIGAVTGAVVGLSSEAVRSQRDDERVATILRELKPGQASVVIEAEEGSAASIDRIAAERHGRVSRKAV